MTFGLVDQQCPGCVPVTSQCFVYGVHSPNKMIVGKMKFKLMWTTTEAQINARKPFEKLSMKMYAQMLSFTSAIPYKLSIWPIHRNRRYFSRFAGFLNTGS
jgi:hypothetical protein